MFCGVNTIVCQNLLSLGGRGLAVLWRSAPKVLLHVQGGEMVPLPCSCQSPRRRQFLSTSLHTCAWVVSKSLFLVFWKWMSVDAHNRLISSIEKQELLQCSFSYKFCHGFLCYQCAVKFQPCLLQIKQHFDCTPEGKRGLFAHWGSCAASRFVSTEFTN